ncbi:MAG TPA: hypothetical protein VHY35_08960 [Stellaceae bacterium]|jgi:hypothetical protein|nr:hypothetical protein [Stellaceae bacterium]
MPIKAEMRWFYPIDWPQLSRHVRFDAPAAFARAAVNRTAKLFAARRTDAGTTLAVALGAMTAASHGGRISRKQLAAGKPASSLPQPTSITIRATIGQVTSRVFVSAAI